jgi:two-component system, chemotaxis family, response regulator Rcp1
LGHPAVRYCIYTSKAQAGTERHTLPENVLLYVEDEDAAVFLLETALKEAAIPAQLYRVSDGEQALAFLRKAGAYEKAPRPDLILLDLNLPRKTGFEVLSEVQHEHMLRDISVVVFTSSSLAADRKRSLALGAKRYITKPSSFDGFIEAVKEACSSFWNGKSR